MYHAPDGQRCQTTCPDSTGERIRHLHRAPRPLSFAYLGQGIALGRHNAIGFNNYPDDKPIPTYFTGWLGYLIREGFVRLLATAVQHGAIVWPGKRRYERAQRRQQAKAQKDSLQLYRV